MRTRWASGAAGLLLVLGAHNASVQAGAGDAPLPTFSDGKPAQLVVLLPTVIKTNNVDTDVICTNLGTAAADIGFEVFDETGASRNAINAGLGAQLNVAPGATVTIGTGTTALLHEDVVIAPFNGAGNAVNSLRNGSGRILASAAGVRCVAFAADSLHDIKDPTSPTPGCPAPCRPPMLTVLSNPSQCTPEQCDDGNPCTADSCDGSGACQHAAANGVPCDDGDPCTTGDVCNTKVCAGTPVVCGADTPCFQSASCDPGAGTCLGTTPFSSCAPGGGDPATDCAAEYVVDNPANAGGVTSDVHTCAQGDANCDFDLLRKRCTFHVRICLNSRDVNLAACVDPGVMSYELRAPTTGPSRRGILDAVAALAPSARGGKARRRVTFGTPLTTGDRCTSSLPVTVPLGKSVSLKVRATTGSGAFDDDRLKLRCARPPKP